VAGDAVNLLGGEKENQGAIWRRGGVSVPSPLSNKSKKLSRGLGGQEEKRTEDLEHDKALGGGESGGTSLRHNAEMANTRIG